MTTQHGDDRCHHGITTIPGDLPGYQWRPSMSLDRVRGRAWTVTDGVFRALVVEGDEGVIAFDTFWSPGSAAQYREAIARLFPRKPIHTIIYTHDHLDHTGFGEVLAPGAETVIAHELTSELIRARGADGQRPPTKSWRGERLPVSIDGAEFELIYPGPTHGTGNTAVYFPEERFLHMVDTVIVGAHYNIVPDFAWTSWIPNTRRLLGLDWDLYVPGHFWNLSRREFEADFELWDVTADTAQRALHAGVDVDDFAEVKRYTYELLDTEWGNKTFRFDEFMAINVLRHMVHFQTGSWGLSDNHPHDRRPFHSDRPDLLGAWA